MSAPTIPILTTPSRVKSRVLVEISIGGTSVLVDWTSARRLLDSLTKQLETAEIIRISIDCASTGSKIVNFPIMAAEARSLIQTLDWFVND